jgi:hypothetical protein
VREGGWMNVEVRIRRCQRVAGDWKTERDCRLQECTAEHSRGEVGLNDGRAAAAKSLRRISELRENTEEQT